MKSIVRLLYFIIFLIFNDSPILLVLAANEEICCESKPGIQNVGINRICNLFTNLKDCNNIPSCNYGCIDQGTKKVRIFKHLSVLQTHIKHT